MRSLLVPLIVRPSATLEDVERKENKIHNSICKRVMFSSIKKKEINNNNCIVIITSNELFYQKLRKKNKNKLG